MKIDVLLYFFSCKWEYCNAVGFFLLVFQLVDQIDALTD